MLYCAGAIMMLCSAHMHNKWPVKTLPSKLQRCTYRLMDKEITVLQLDDAISNDKPCTSRRPIVLYVAVYIISALFIYQLLKFVKRFLHLFHHWCPLASACESTLIFTSVRFDAYCCVYRAVRNMSRSILKSLCWISDSLNFRQRLKSMEN